MAKKFLFFFLLITSVFLVETNFVNAASNYVLPYPSYMPGNFFYKPRLILSKFSYYIYFGDFGKFEYNLKESDHYLVEARTLFEYKQYLLGVSALNKSDYYFSKLKPSLENAQLNGKNISEKNAKLGEASVKHKETLRELEEVLPENFNWSPEKSESTNINFQELISNSIRLRNI